MNRLLAALLLLGSLSFGSGQEPVPSPPLVSEPFVPSAPSAPAIPPRPPLEAEEPPVARAGVVNEREAIAQLQIFLDQKHFGPGKIDGGWGEFTGKALNYYEEVNGLPITTEITSWATVGDHLPMEDVYPIYTAYTITEEDAKRIGSIPRSYAAQTKQGRMPYTSLVEFLGERFHSDPNFLRKLNPTLNMDDLKVGDAVRVPNVEPFRIEEVKEIAKLPKREEFLNREIRINTRTKILRLMEDGKLVSTFPITPGSASLPAPRGTWRIVGITELPWFRRDDSMLNHGVRSSNFHMIPAGPNNPVGVIWMALSKSGIGIHGTNSPDTIGRSGSHGCIRLANWDAIRLAKMVTEGMTVKIDQPEEGPEPEIEKAGAPATPTPTPTPAASPAP
jgi:lipoprotein-anchoring transpeptidase ErfK/SrfK